jgi:glutamine amidotransferase
MRDVVVVDLGLGNLHSVLRAFERAGAKPVLTSDADAIARADRVVVPGQGAFRECSVALGSGLGGAIASFIETGKPYLGICLGMQLLFESSEEAEGAPGLGLYRGRVARFGSDLHDPETGARLKVPHMGWNRVVVSNDRAPVENGAWYYFTHSYCCVPADPSIAAVTFDYGGSFCAATAKDNVFACQFHPEKSHRAGSRLIERWLAGGESWS